MPSSDDLVQRDLMNYSLVCVCADVPVGDDQRCGGDSSRYCQQGAHHLWEHAGPL